MRYIDINVLGGALPADWKRNAQAALEDVRAAKTKDERRAKLTKHAGVWAAAKPHLKELSNKKCWYCESKDLRNDNAVDHFRPKGKVAEDAQHPGYWWLAFAWSNFRYSCTFCNSRRRDIESGSSGGKQDHFPLLDESLRVSTERECSVERPILLDPTVAADTLLIYFSEDGGVIPRQRAASQDVLQRVSQSIELYHLYHSDLVDRRIELFNQVKSLIELGRKFYFLWLQGDADAEAAFGTAVASLKSMVSEAAEFSQAARDMIRGFRENDHPWIDQIA